jgi:hypothetical protein
MLLSTSKRRAGSRLLKARPLPTTILPPEALDVAAAAVEVEAAAEEAAVAAGEADVAPLDVVAVAVELPEAVVDALVDAVVDFDEPPQAAKSPPTTPRLAPPAISRSNPRRLTCRGCFRSRELEASSGIMPSHLSELDTLRAFRPVGPTTPTHATMNQIQ